MLKNTLSSVLVSVASQYAQLSPSDVGIGIGGGRLVIDNVKLRADTFNGPHIPFHVYEGRAGRLRVQVPWSALSSSPVEVYIENVHLHAGPKLNTSTSENHSLQSKQSSTTRKNLPWHQTIVGRLLFNVSVQIFGLNVEYRDEQCMAVFSLASLTAFSADSDWQQKFISLAIENDNNDQDTTNAITMRKFVKLTGVHCVMIPRHPQQINKDQNQESDDENTSFISNDDRRLDMNSFESNSPILDGVSINIKVLVCTGSAHIPNLSSQPIPGMHMEVDIDIEEPKLSLTARQIAWIDYIVKQSLANIQGRKQTNQNENSQQINYTKRRPRSQRSHSETGSITIKTEEKSETSNEHKTIENDINTINIDKEKTNEDVEELQNNNEYTNDQQFDVSPSAMTNDTVEVHSDDEDEDEFFDDENEEETFASPEAERNPLVSFWRAIISENGDETIDDAAIALGFSDVQSDIDSSEDQEANTKDIEIDIYARNAVTAAAHAGGLTLKVNLVTPDVKAWDKVAKLEEELAQEKEMRLKLEDLESTLLAAENRVKEYEAEAKRLQEKNESLVCELRDLEKMTSQAGKNKDAMIRQTEAALTKAERNLQALLQEKFEKQNYKQDETDTSPIITKEDIMVSERNEFTIESTHDTVIVHDDIETSNEGDGLFINGTTTTSETRNTPIVEDSPNQNEESEEDISTRLENVELKTDQDESITSEVGVVDMKRKTVVDESFPDPIPAIPLPEKNHDGIEQAISSEGLTLI